MASLVRARNLPRHVFEKLCCFKCFCCLNNSCLEVFVFAYVESSNTLLYTLFCNFFPICDIALFKLDVVVWWFTNGVQWHPSLILHLSLYPKTTWLSKSCFDDKRDVAIVQYRSINDFLSTSEQESWNEPPLFSTKQNTSYTFICIHYKYIIAL